MSVYKYLRHKVDDVLTDATSVVLSSSDGMYGIKNLDTGAVVVANNAAVTNPSTGVYQYDISALSAGVNYRISWKVVYAGQTKYVTEDFNLDVAEPISLTEAKAHLKIEPTETADDDYITDLITAVRIFAEGYQGRTYITATKTFKLESWPSQDYIRIPHPPLQSITHIKYIDSEGTEHTWDSSNYVAEPDSEDKMPGKVYLAYDKSWPSETLRPGMPITVTFVAGYGNADQVPKHIKQALLLLIGHFYENREAVNSVKTGIELPFGVKALLGQDRVFSF